MENTVARKLLTGDFSNVPKLPSKVVRIFLSSTFGDMTAERNYIIDELEPLLQQWCMNQGLEFQLVDMRWGVRDEVTADHMTTVLCLQEIAKCQELSLGPNFVFLLGQRYGYRPLSANILSTEFEEVISSIKDPTYRDLVERWYRQDSNLVPAAHVLQPITGISKEEWETTSVQLEKILRQEADALYKAGKMTFKEWQKYFISVTEQEIRVALEVENPNNHCLGFIREISDLYENLDDSTAKRYCDMKEDGPDEEARELLDEFKLKYVPSVLSGSILQKYQIKWTPNGIDPQVAAHQKYLRTINTNFFTWAKSQVLVAKKRSENVDLANDPLMTEIVHHANFCASKCATFHGCDETLQQIFDRIVMSSESKPLVLHGMSGSGKTSMVAMVAKQAKDSRGENINVILRFLGTSSQSSSIQQVLQNVVKHICKLYDLPLPGFNTMDNFNNLILYFPSLLESVSNHPSQIPLLLILDSLDQLEDSNRAYGCKWLPRKCPKMVQIVLSTLPDMFHILERLRQVIVNEDCFIPVQPLSEGTGSEILQHWMASINRKISDEQNEVVRKVFSKCPQPLFLKLLFEQARRWKSYDEVRAEELASTVREAIGLLYERLERQFGKKLVSHALGYVTAARNGLTQDELQHILSLDDEVLDELYQYWPPPDPKEVALPPLIWARLRFELQEYMVERQANGRTVMTLYHRQFTEAARERYLGTDEIMKSRHKVMADFFTGKWANKEKPLQLTLNSTTLSPLRMVPQQPVSFQTDYNRRKLHELPYHLTHAGEECVEEICQLVYGNFEFLYSYVKAFSVQLMVEEITATLKAMPEEHYLRLQLELLRDTLRLAKPTVEFEGSQQTLSVEILARLLGLADTVDTDFNFCLKPLLDGAWDDCQKDPRPQLVPVRGCFPQPGGTLKTTLVGHAGNINKIHVNKNCSMLASASEDGMVRIWDLNADETIYILICDSKSPMVDAFISSDDRWIVALNSDGALCLWGMQTGDLVYTIQTTSPESKNIGLLVTDDNKKIVCLKAHNIGVYNIEDGNLLFNLEPTSDVLTSVCRSLVDDTIIAGTQSGAILAWSLENGSSLNCSKPEESDQFGGVLLIASCHGDTCKGIVYATENGHVVFAQKCDSNSDALFEVRKVCSIPSPMSCKALCVNNVGTTAWVAAGSLVHCFQLEGEGKEANYTLKGYRTDILSLVISHDDKYLIGGQINDVMMVWMLDVSDSTPKALHPLQGLNADVSHLAYAEVGHHHMVVSASTNLPYIKLWDLQKVSADPTINKTFFYKEGPLVLTSDSQYVVSLISELSMTREESFVLNVWDSMSGKTHQVCRSSSFANCLAITSNDLYLFYSAEDGVVSQHNLQTGEDVCCLKGGHGKVCHIEVRIDDKYLLVLKQNWDIGNYFLELWHLATQRHHTIKLDQKGGIKCATLTEQNLVVLGGDMNKILLCDSNGNQSEMKCTKGNQEMDGVDLMVLSHDEKLLAVKTPSQKVHVWNLKKRLTMQSLTKVGKVRSMAFTKSGEFLVTGADDRVIKVWSISDGSLYQSLYVYGNVVKLATNSDTIVAATEVGHLIEVTIHRGSGVRPTLKKTAGGKTRLCTVV